MNADPIHVFPWDKNKKLEMRIWIHVFFRGKNKIVENANPDPYFSLD
jgi:hypothetical protein